MDVGTTAQWAAAGISPKRLRTMVRHGELIRQRHGTYATAQAVAAAGEDKAHQHALDVRAVLAATSARGVVASHESAALMHSLPLLKEPGSGVVSLTCPAGLHAGRSASGVRFHAAGLPPGHLATKGGVPVTTIARTVIDLARTLPFMDAVVVADAAIRRRTGKSQLRDVLTACGGWPGADRARRVVDFGNGLAGSPLESCARVAFDAFGLPPPELQAEIIGGTAFLPDGRVRISEYHEYKVDFLWKQYKTAAETDGLMKYGNPQAAIDELKRDRLIREAGYKLVHITWQELLEHPERVIERILTAFQATSAY
jgi:hypothetical protein